MQTLLHFSLVLLAACIYVYNQPETLLRVLGKVQIDPANLIRWSNSSALNNADCQVNYAANACEDVKIHSASNTAFLACGDPIERTHWYPPACIRRASERSEASFREQLFKYDIATGRTTELKIEGLQGDFVTHGIDIYSLPDNPKKIHIFAVKHSRDGDSIAIFSHDINSDVVQLVKDVKHSNIKTANGVAASGPLDFYFTNDHYFVDGWRRKLEEMFGPWSWATNVQYCDASIKDVFCKQVSPTFPGANGIALWEDQVFVGDSKNGTVTIFRIQPDRNLEKLRSIELGAAADNINIIPTTGDLVISIFPTIEDLQGYLRNVRSLGRDFLAPSAALRLRRGSDRPELVFFDDGSVLSDMTAAAIDPSSKVFIGAAVLQYGGFAVCKLSSDALV